MHLFLDESGNTGTALLDPNQPVFALAGTSIPTDVAEELVAPFKNKGQKEAKYSRLKSSRPGQQLIVSLFSSKALSPETTRVFLADKRYYLSTQLIDKLIEPIYYEANIDLHAEDAAASLSNVFYYIGPHMFPNGAWDRLLESFLVALRNRDSAAFSDFISVAEPIIANRAMTFDELTEPLLLALSRLQDFLGVYDKKEVFDPAVDLFVLHVQHAMKLFAGQIEVTHDSSKPLAKMESFLRTLMNRNIDTRMTGYGERKMEFPFRVSRLNFADSQAHPQLQLADILAGCAVDCLMAWAGQRPMHGYHEALQGSQLPQLVLGGLLPSPDIEKAPAPLPGEENLVDGAARFLRDADYFGKNE